ncbi:Glycerate kinase [Pseudocercospora fuligena]|uniref:Glycerate kinase n=1 Tax=Pseudocercospora fuligena TaxID=685502 RepID=A0A8H6VHT3_9PEZI|nr:Glycerate kinase [Pseudocercospora fuligena]
MSISNIPTDRLKRVQEAHQPRILICPSGFKESLQPVQVADCIETGVLRAVPEAVVTKAPMVDGGEGFTKALVESTSGILRQITVTGPVRDPVSSHYGFLGASSTPTAVVEMAAAAGLSLVPRDQRNPLHTTTYGVGSLIGAALDDGATNILLGCGDSGTCDGGIGMAQALGARFFDSHGKELPCAQGGASLHDLAEVDLSGLHPRLKEVQIDVACNWHNVLCGPKGVARVFGPQKGATPEEVELLSKAMDSVSAIVSKEVGKDISLAPGSGASGGMGAGLMLIGAHLHPRFDIITKFLNIQQLVQSCDMVITAEGGIDEQTPRGKIPAEVARIAKTKGVPVIALAGTVGVGARSNYAAGIDAYASILQAPCNLQTAINQAETLLIDCAESVTRMVMVGWQLKKAMRPVVEKGADAGFVLRRSKTLIY